MFLIILVLFSISLFPEVVNLDFTLELRALVLAVFATGFFVFLSLGGNCPKSANAFRQFIFRVCTKIIFRRDSNEVSGNKGFSTLVKNRIKITSLDVAYISCVLLTILSFVTKVQNINAFHFVFVAVGMFVVYSVIRIANSDEIILQSKIIYSVIGIAFIIAMIGLIQFAMGKSIVSTFGRTSYLGCFLAMNGAVAFGLALQLRIINYDLRFKKSNIGFWIAGLAFVVIVGVTVLTKSRSAMIALAVVLPIMIVKWKSGKVRKWEGQNPLKTFFTHLILRINSAHAWKRGLQVLLFAFIIIFAIFGCKYLYKLKPMSASGRTLIWKVSTDMFRKNPISGVGFGNFANSYNLYQANYFVSGKGTSVNKMTAGQIRHAYNWYLETAAEFGFLGLIVFGIFWWLILKNVFDIFKKNFTENGSRATDYVTIGMAGAVLCFMIMSLFQFPRKIIPTYLLFNFALAWIVNANLEENSKTQMINNKQIPKEENL